MAETKYTKRTIERLRKVSEGKPVRVRQGDDLLIFNLIDLRWGGGKTPSTCELTQKGREVLAALDGK